MRLLQRRRQAAPAENRWRPTGEGVTEYSDGELPDQGDRYGNSYAVTFWNPALGGCQITVRYYAVQYADWQNDEWGVEQCVEWSIADAPGDDPSWHSSETRLVNETAFYDLAEAEQAAAEAAAEDDSDSPPGLNLTWNGRPFDDASVIDSRWEPDGDGITSAGNDTTTTDGATQVSESLCVRLRNPAHPLSVIDLMFYAITLDGETSSNYYLEMTAEWIVCDDPENAATTASWTEGMSWVCPTVLTFHAAAQRAMGWANSLNDGSLALPDVLSLIDPRMDQTTHPVLTWDGEPFTWAAGEDDE
jgi:hypothetical protein